VAQQSKTDNDVAIAAIEADTQVQLAEIHAETAIAIEESNNEARVEIAEAQANQDDDKWQMVTNLVAQVEALTLQVAALVTPIAIVEAPLSSSEEVTEAEVEALAETLPEPSLTEVSTQGSTSSTQMELSESVEAVSLEVPGVVVNDKPVRVPIIQLV
jgi:hypothetical protein